MEMNIRIIVEYLPENKNGKVVYLDIEDINNDDFYKFVLTVQRAESLIEDLQNVIDHAKSKGERKKK